MNGVMELEVMPGPVGATTAEDQQAAETRRLVDRIHRLPVIRVEKIYGVRRLIARGEFETPDRIDGTVERLPEELGCQAGFAN
jgi:hypothetical protein